MPRGRLYSGYRPGANTVQSPEQGRKVARTLGLKENAPLQSISPEIVATVTLADLTRENYDDIEVAQPAFDTLELVTYGAAITTTFRFANRAGSGKTIEVVDIAVFSDKTVTWRLSESVTSANIELPAPDSTGSPHWRHQGIQPIPGTSYFGVQNNHVGSLGGFCSYARTNATAPMAKMLEPGFPMYLVDHNPPGRTPMFSTGGGAISVLAFHDNTANTLVCAIRFIERRERGG